MKTTLPLGLAGLGAKPGLGNEAGSHDDSRDFSAMLQSSPPERQPLPPRPRTPPTQREMPRQDPDAGAAREPTPRPRGEAQAGPRDSRNPPERDAGRAGSSRPQAASAGPDRREGVERPAGQQAQASGRDEPAGDKPGQDTSPADAPWPPAGLGGLEAVLAASANVTPPAGNPASATLPNAPQATSAPAAVGATGTPPPLPATAAAAAVPGQAPPLPGTAGPAAAGDFAAKLADAGATAAPAKAVAANGADAGSVEGAAPQAPDSAALLALHAPAAHAGGTRGSGAVFDGSPTPTPHLHEGFDDAVGTRLSWLADQKIGHAHIKISPDDLGPVEVRLQLDGDKVQASFTSAHADVRQALEQSIPRLRELLGQQGFQLAHADVGGQSQQGRGSDGSGDSASRNAPSGGDDAAAVGIPAAVLRRRGLLDAYA